MDPKFNSSFIPKKMLQEDVTGKSSSSQYVKHRTVMGPTYFLTLTLFVLAILVSGFLFAWTQVVDRRVEDKIATLEAKNAAYDDTIVQDLLRVDSRLSEATNLLNAHVAFTELLDVLEELTVRTISYDGLSFALDEQTGALELEVTGIAPTFRDAAVQADTFRSEQFLQNPTVTRLSRNNDDLAGFAITASIDPRLITYTTALQEQRRAPGAVRVPVSVEPVAEVAQSQGDQPPMSEESEL